MLPCCTATDPTALGAASDETLRLAAREATHDGRGTLLTPKQPLILKTRGDDCSDSLECFDPLAGYAHGFPEPGAVIRVKNDTAALTMALDPFAQVAKACRGTQSKRNASHQQ